MCSDVESFKKSAIDEDLPRQRFIVTREDGMEELKRDILSNYKSGNCKLNAKPRVCFEGEGVGGGPIREYFLCAMKIAQEGIGGGRRAIIFFEGEKDHLVPIHDQALRCTGSFNAIGRIIAHSFIHNGPLLYGISPAVKRFWALTAAGNEDDVVTLLASLTINDIPDVDLRGYIEQVNCQPRTQGLCSWGGEDPGRGWSRVTATNCRLRGCWESIKLHASTRNIPCIISSSFGHVGPRCLFVLPGVCGFK